MKLKDLLVRHGLLFENASEELGYQSFRLDRTYRLIPVAIALTLSAWLAFAVWDPTGPADSSPTRFRLLAIPFFALLLIASLVPGARRFWRLTTSLLTIGGAFGVFWVLHLLDADTPFGLSTGAAALNAVLILGIGLALCPTPMFLGFVLSTCVLTLYAAFVQWLTEVSAFELAGYLFNLLFVQSIFLLLCFWRERALRQEFSELRLLTRERNTLDKLLSDVLPRDLVARVDAGETIAESFGEVTILFADLVGFTRLTSRLAPRHLVETLDRLFSAFDAALEQTELEKVKTIGDAYMVVGGTRTTQEDPTVQATRLGGELIELTHQIATDLGQEIDVRVGIHTGSVIGGVIGRRKKVYDYWGETVNVASRLESTGVPGAIRVSEAAYWRLRSEFPLEEAEPLAMPDGSTAPTFLVANGARARTT